MKQTQRTKFKKKSQQLELLKSPIRRQAHGGSLAVGKRRSKRPLSTKHSLHVTLKSHHAVGGRCLLKHKKLIQSVMKKSSRYFHVRVYNHAITGNHLHLSVRGKTRTDIQNFFRVFAGHTAQRILKECLLTPKAGGAPKKGKPPCKKNQRQFWSYLTYSRIVSWGREFRRVSTYITRNTMEALHLIAYTPRERFRPPKSQNGPFSLDHKSAIMPRFASRNSDK